jgi:hypothetical protein
MRVKQRSEWFKTVDVVVSENPLHECGLKMAGFLGQLIAIVLAQM